VSDWGVFVHTETASDAEAALSFDTQISNTTDHPMDVQIAQFALTRNVEIEGDRGRAHTH
jgi:hypothetical protein